MLRMCRPIFRSGNVVFLYSGIFVAKIIKELESIRFVCGISYQEGGFLVGRSSW